ncbi:hypothetical protein TREMEDRAFT_34550, partial [Tremella mesenterica DSM 1558]|uniref:uncharacterized protein n=1 Tax=Tremella mesenterica (strain ATCC 24925 / CBS 8224 / DSM 1558 / NBRC 9311 / NRRL Y-6157 / RJB 2259-6 / UBC 559-6) TaxID=578456 RepID=UPI00032C1E84
KLSRTEFRRQKELETARKAGTAPAATDTDGNAINPHIPEYISRAPWYADPSSGAPSLAHQRLGEDKAPHLKLEEWYDRGAKAGPAAKKYRKGACENCGAMTHSKKDCVERPRKRGAKFTNKNIVADEVIQSFEGDYDAKRDRWNGYDPATYKMTVVDEYEAAEAARTKYREEQMDKEDEKDNGKIVIKDTAEKDKVVDDEFGSSDGEDEVEIDAAEAADQVGQKLDTNTRLTVRNLRIREDTAKYLINLDPGSAYYDPKTRAMRDAPEKNVALEDQRFAGDNFERYSGDATNMQKLQLFAWQSEARGSTIHAQGNPTAGELLMKEFNQKKEVLKNTSKTSILAKYGGEEHLERLPKELLTGESGHYVEYSRSGQIVKGHEKAKVRSKYDEDVYINNHTSVWGSWFDRSTAQWGFACCHSIISGSYCTGAAGKSATESSSAAALLSSAAEKARIEHQSDKKRKDRDESTSTNYAQTRLRIEDGEEVELDKGRLKKAIEEEKRRKGLGEEEAWKDSKKKTTEVSQEELEAYRLSRQAYDDPMANYKDTEG